MTDRKSAAISGRMVRRSLLTSAIGTAVLLGLFVSAPATAGGDAFTAEVLGFQALGNNEHRIVLRQMTGLYGPTKCPAEPLVIYLRHDEDVMRSVPKNLVSREEYLAAIELLKQQIAQSTTIQAGVMGGSGLMPIDGKPGEFQSNSLSIEQPPYPEPGIARIVVAWRGPV